MEGLFKDGYINYDVKTMLYIAAVIELTPTTGKELTTACGDEIKTYAPCFRHVNLLLGIN